MSKEYLIPDPSKEPVKAIVIFYKITKGVEYDDRVWDKIHFERCSRASKELFETCGTFESSKKCIEELSNGFQEAHLGWTLETIVKHAHDWISKRRQRNDKQVRQRFYDALNEQRSNPEGSRKGEPVTGGQILNSLGNMQVFQSEEWAEGRLGASADGSVGERIQPNPVEEKESRKIG